MPIAASTRAEAPKTVINSMLNRWREIDLETTSVMERISDTGRPLT
jgi:hypothetical protein